jgi:hypothetical protein
MRMMMVVEAMVMVISDAPDVLNAGCSLKLVQGEIRLKRELRWLPDPNREQIHEDIYCAQCGKYEKKDLAAQITATVFPSTPAAWFNVCSRCAKYYKEQEVVCNGCLGGFGWSYKTMK